MKQNDTISPRQFVAVAVVAVLSPLIRRFPRALVMTAGRTAWLAAPLAALPLLPALLLARLLFRNRAGRAGLAELQAAALGSSGGRLLTALYTLWLLFYAGFLLRSGAIRFVSMVYQGASPGLFIVCMALLCGMAALGPLRALARAAMLLRPLLAAVLAVILLMTAKDIDPSLLFPVTPADLPSGGCAALQVANLLGVSAYLSFFGDRVAGTLRARDYAGWLAALLGFIGLMSAGCVGMFGPELTAGMTYPFFMLARDVSVLGALERVEPVVIAVWVFADFIFVSALLWISARNLRFCAGLPEGEAPSGPADLRGGRWLALLCTASAAFAAFLLPGELTEFYRFSERLVPIGTAVMAFALPLLVLLVGKLRRTL